MTNEMTNKEFAGTNAMFIEACKRANITPTSRQAGKWQRHVGLAWMTNRGHDNQA